MRGGGRGECDRVVFEKAQETILKDVFNVVVHSMDVRCSPVRLVVDRTPGVSAVGMELHDLSCMIGVLFFKSRFRFKSCCAGDDELIPKYN